MIESRVGTPGIRWTALSSYAAGVAGILANLFLVAFFALQASQPENGTWLGSANDLVGSVSTALMILFGAGGVLAVIGMLGTPFWFLFLGRRLGWP